MSSITGVSGYPFPAAAAQSTARPATVVTPPPANDPDHDGDTDKPGRVDVKA